MEDDEDLTPPQFSGSSRSGEQGGSGAPQLTSTTRLSHEAQAAFNELAYELRLDPQYRELALRVVERPATEAPQAMILFLGAILQEVRTNNARMAISPAQGEMGSVALWTPSTELNEHVRRYAASVLTNPDLESYTATDNDQKITLNGSFEAKVIAHLNQQQASWKARLLPPRLGLGNDPGPARLLVAYVKRTIKHNRDTFRKMILSCVLNEYKQPPSNPIPKLLDLIMQIIIGCGCAGINNRDQVMANITMEHKMQFAFLRLAGLYYYTHPTSNKNHSQWTLIDSRLASLRRQTNLYRQAFYALVLEQDQRLFGDGTALFTTLCSQPALFELPTDAEVENRESQLQTRLGNNARGGLM